MEEGFKKKIRKNCLELQRGQVMLIEKKNKNIIRIGACKDFKIDHLIFEKVKALNV